MQLKILIPLLLCLAIFHPSLTKNVGRVQKNARLECEDLGEYLNNLEPRYTAECRSLKNARWEYTTNVDGVTQQAYVQAKKAFLDFQAITQAEIQDEGFLDCIGQPDGAMREVKYLTTHGPGSMAATNYEKLTELQSQFETAHASAKVCEYQNVDNCELRLEPDVEQKLQVTSNPDELEWYWTQWHNKIGETIEAPDFAELVDLQNELAKANDFDDMSELWLHKYDSGAEGWTPGQFKETLQSLWDQLQPVYSKLFAYVRMHLRNVPEYRDNIKRFGSFPMHYTRNLWSRDWLHLDESTKPFSEISTLDATEAMQEAGLTVDNIFHAADTFITQLGLPPMPQDFWDNSMWQRPEGREFICDASAEDMCGGSTDFRVKLCANVTLKDLLRASKYTGHIEYFLQYANQHFIFRSAANPAFYDGLAGTFSLVTSTPEYLQCKGGINMQLGFECPLVEPYDPKIDINYLYRIALEKFPLIAFAFSTNRWRWEVYDGSVAQTDYNKRLYEIREETEGIRPPAQRNSNGVDAGATYDVLAEDDEFTRQFVGTILQFQIHEALCILAKEYDPTSPTTKPLHQCDFYAKTEVGDKIREVMAQGFSRPWPDLLETITGTRTLSTSSMLKYFQPLFNEIDTRLADAGDYPCFRKGCEPFAKHYVAVEYETEASRLCNNASLASWAYETDLTNPEAEAENEAANLRYALFRNREWKEKISEFELELFDESDAKRQLEFLNNVGVAALESEDLQEFNQILSRMTRIYGTAKVCPYNNRECDLESEGIGLEPGLEGIMANSRSYYELAYVWTEWRAATGRLMREDYNRYVELSNQAAGLNGYDNMGDFWIHRYESETFKSDMEDVWETVKGMYIELHAYVRFRLRQTYPQMGTNADDPIPAHLLGNMWSQTWSNIYSLVLPFNDAPVFDVTDKLKADFQEDIVGIRRIFQMADNFFTSLGLEGMAMAFGDKAMIMKPEDGREVICHASAWDFCDGEDFRIKMCTNVNMEDFITVHHELGHIQYDLQYRHLNITFREGANPGFHEAIGDVISLSVSTPKHMYRIGLSDEWEMTKESTINFLMRMALDKIAFLPFGFLIDSYRWKVFDGGIPRENLTYNWMKMRSDFQGIRPPAMRTEDDFDPGAKFHVPADVPYIRYFFSYILQFQIHRELCLIAGQYDPSNPEDFPLHNCDIFRNTAAGAKFKQILEAGGSTNWQELLYAVTGERNLNAQPLLDYFAPLIEFFVEQRTLHGYPLGWNPNTFEDYYGDGELPPIPTTPEPPTTPTAETTPTPSTGTTDPSARTPDPSTGTTDPSARTPDPSTGTTDPSARTPDPSTGTTDPSARTPDPSTGTTDPSARTPDPSTGTTDPLPPATTDPSTGTPDPPPPATTDPPPITTDRPTTNGPTGSTTEEASDDDGINTVALVIGIVLGVVVVVIIVGYFVTTKLGIGPLAKGGFR